RQACRKSCTRMEPSGARNLTMVSDARLQAVTSRNMYYEQGLLALIRPSAGQVCHSLIVVSNCTPGSAHAHAENATFSHRSAASTRLWTRPSVRPIRSQVPPCSIARKKALGTRTELLEFWPETVR